MSYFNVNLKIQYSRKIAQDSYGKHFFLYLRSCENTKFSVTFPNDYSAFVFVYFF